MALDATIGGASADTYATLAEAEAYVSTMGLTFSGDDAAKEQALRRAAVWLDATYRTYWPGQKVNGRSQARDWPRSNAYDHEGNLIASDAIPAEIKNAQIEAATREAANSGSLSPDVTNEKVLTTLGPMSWTLTGTGAKSKRPEVTTVDDILGGLLGPIGSAASGTKAVLRA